MMTRRDAILIASRAFALYLICWALTDVTYLPQTVFSLRHHSSALITHDYLWTYYRVEAVFRLIRILALFVTATWLLKGSKGVEDFFLPTKVVNAPEQTE
jgi:hypothetical protein